MTLNTHIFERNPGTWIVDCVDYQIQLKFTQVEPPEEIAIQSVLDEVLRVQNEAFDVRQVSLAQSDDFDAGLEFITKLYAGSLSTPEQYFDFLQTVNWGSAAFMRLVIRHLSGGSQSPTDEATAFRYAAQVMLTRFTEEQTINRYQQLISHYQ